MADEIPLWAMDRAIDLAKAQVGSYPTVAAFARYIAEHEEPPVDPFEQELERIAYEVIDLWRASGGGRYVCKNFALAALRRGMELAKQGDQS